MRNETESYLVRGHHRSFQSFERSVKEDCYICGRLWRTQSRLVQKILQDEYNEYANKLSETSFFTELHCELAESKIDVVGVIISVPVPNKKPCRFECNKLPGMFFFYHDTLWLTISLATPMSSDTTSSTESIRVARDWLHNCFEHHPGCKRSDLRVSWYPTRLLYLGETSNDDTNVRLIHTAQDIPTGPYMTLSHRWGSVDILKLTRATMPVFCNTIVLEDLPKTFRDAIIVTKTLGIRYLWIDSLCILQDKDDLSDWSYEAGLMYRVYVFSHCNIFASVSEDGSQGLFRPRNPRSIYGPKFTFGTFGLGTSAYCIESHLKDYEIWETNITSGVLNSRGWVFQERLLAPRVLHFGHDQLFWECRQSRACEAYPLSNSWSDVLEREAPTLRGTFGPNGRMRTKYDSMQRGGQLESWKNIVTVYSGKNLTNSGDKLIALSGIARCMAVSMNSQYFAGLWGICMATQLLWYCNPFSTEDTTFNSVPPAYRAPTWSWASTDRQVVMNYVDTRNEMLFRVTDVVLQHATEDVTGCVMNGHLDLEGYLLPMILHENTLTPGPFQAIATGPRGSNKTNLFEMHLDAPKSRISSILDDSTEGRLFYMVATHLEHTIQMLMLRVNLESSLFERIGIGLMFNYNTETTVETLLSTLSEQERTALPCLRYDNGMHTVRII
jgi:hypothetical protein